MTRTEKNTLLIVGGVAVVFFLSQSKINPIDQVTEMITGKYTLTPARKAILATINWAEGKPGYDQLFGYGYFNNNGPHPNKKIPFGNTYSTAAGAYQFLYSTWQDSIKKLSIPDFMSKDNQDQAALNLIDYRKALGDIDSGDIESAITKMSYEWASLPPGRYGQPIRSMPEVLNYYNQQLQNYS